MRSPLLRQPPGHPARSGHRGPVVTGHPARLSRSRPPCRRPRTARRADRPQRPRPGRGDAGTTRPAAELGDVPPPATDRLPPLRRPPSRRQGGPAPAPPHLLLLRRYGWAATYDAVLTGLMLCAHIWSPEGRPSPFGCWDVWDDRLDVLIPFDREKQDYVGFSTAKLFAVVYPEAVALAPLIASPYWRWLAGGTEAEQARFFAEVAGRVTYPYLPPDRRGDAVAHWALADSWRPPSRPLTTYTPGRVRGTLPGLAANRLARHEKSAMWFSRSGTSCSCSMRSQLRRRGGYRGPGAERIAVRRACPARRGSPGPVAGAATP